MQRFLKVKLRHTKLLNTLGEHIKSKRLKQ